MYAWYVVCVLHIASLLSFLDRLVLSLLIDPIRTDLQISDTEVSLVTGTAFALFYGFMALPMGRLADSHNRTRIISIGICIWSLLTAACGLAQNFWQLFIARMGVGVGEASLAGTAYSLLADYFRPARLPLAVSFYIAAALVGSGAALIAGGWVIQTVSSLPPIALPMLGALAPWQMTLIVVGLPGIAVSLLVLTVREPARRGRLYPEAAGQSPTRALPLSEVIRFVRERRSVYLPHFLGFGVGGIYAYAVFVWTPTFFMRTFEWTAPQAGLRFGTVVLLFGLAGTCAGGLLATRWIRRGRIDALFRVAIIALSVLGPSSVLAPLLPTSSLALAGFAIVVMLFSMAASVAPTALQVVTPNEMRGQVSSLYSFACIVIGLGAGPTLVALLTDQVFGFDGALRYSLSIVGGVVSLAAASILALGCKSFGHAVLAARQGSPA